jgi:putative DNA primase/helicase
VNVDETPDRGAREDAWDTFDRLDTLTARDLKAGEDRYNDLPFLRFDPDAQSVFNQWYEGLQKLLRAGDLPAALQRHFAKYTKLFPAIALIHHAACNNLRGSISEISIPKAIRLARYLETHAHRIYASCIATEVAAAKAILLHIRKGDLKEGFRARDVHQKRWAHLSERGHVQSGLDLLCDLDWIAEEPCRSGPGGGRPSAVYRINPAAKNE